MRKFGIYAENPIVEVFLQTYQELKETLMNGDQGKLMGSLLSI